MTKSFVSDFSPVIYKLNDSYRSAKRIVEFANRLEHYDSVTNYVYEGELLGMPMLSIGIDVSKGKSTVCGMKAEIGDVRRFHSKRALIAYAGIDAPPYQSGKFCANNRHISKRGNRYLRKTGYEVMQSYVMHKPANDPICRPCLATLFFCL